MGPRTLVVMGKETLLLKVSVKLGRPVDPP